MAQKKLTRAILACLKLAGQKCHSLHAETNAWAELPDDDADVELWLRGLSWVTKKGPRTLLYNVTVPLVKNNVDLLLFRCSSSDLTRETIRTPSAYIALGELKGGIDPAGADEHWKTARTALNRIHEAFAKQKLKPHRRRPHYIGHELALQLMNYESAKEFALVEQMLAAKPQLARAQSDKDKNFYENKCATLDRQIDALVYDLYGLTADEIKIVEGAT